MLKRGKKVLGDPHQAVMATLGVASDVISASGADSIKESLPKLKELKKDNLLAAGKWDAGVAAKSVAKKTFDERTTNTASDLGEGLKTGNLGKTAESTGKLLLMGAAHVIAVKLVAFYLQKSLP